MPYNRRIRVVHLVSTLNLGGLEKVVYDLVRLADRNRFENHVICIGGIGALADDFQKLGVPTLALDPVGKNGIFATSRRLAKLLRPMKIDVLHTHNPTPHMVGSLTRFQTPIPVLVHTKHGRNYPGNWKRVFVNRMMAWVTDCVVAVSHDAAAVSRDIERVSEHKLRVIQNGIDLARFKGNPTGSRNSANVIHVARLSDPPKDHATLLRAARLVTNHVPNFHLEIVGDGPDRSRLESLRDELQLQNHVTFSGFRSDVCERLANSQLAILSSLTEGLSISLLEAMAMGLPVVATDVGGNRELVVHQQTGILVAPQDPDVMARAMLELIQSPTKAAAFGAAGRERVEKNFCLNGVVERYADLYGELLRRVSREEVPSMVARSPVAF